MRVRVLPIIIIDDLRNYGLVLLYPHVCDKQHEQTGMSNNQRL